MEKIEEFDLKSFFVRFKAEEDYIRKLFSFEGTTFREKGIVGVYDGEDPPVPIPNTVVKLAGAENTWLETARENKTMPTLLFFLYVKESVREVLGSKNTE